MSTKFENDGDVYKTIIAILSETADATDILRDKISAMERRLSAQEEIVFGDGREQYSLAEKIRKIDQKIELIRSEVTYEGRTTNAKIDQNKKILWWILGILATVIGAVFGRAAINAIGMGE